MCFCKPKSTFSVVFLLGVKGNSEFSIAPSTQCTKKPNNQAYTPC